MDGAASSFGVIEDGAAAEAAPRLEAVALDLDRPAKLNDRLSRGTALVVAALAHALLIAAFLFPRSDAIGDEGVALETIAVSIVDTLPVIAAPETPASDAAEPQALTEEPVTEPVPEPPEPQKQSEPETLPEPEAPTLALDLPPYPSPPPPDAPVLPARPPEPVPEPKPVVRDETPPPMEKPPEKKEEPDKQKKETVAQPPPPPPPAPAALPTVSSAEAAPGVVRAYARRISIALDKSKPRSRGMRGKVVVQFVVDTDGKPLPPKVLTSSGNTRLDELVVGAISRINFPAPPSQMSQRQRTFNVPFEYR